MGDVGNESRHGDTRSMGRDHHRGVGRESMCQVGGENGGSTTWCCLLVVVGLLMMLK